MRSSSLVILILMTVPANAKPFQYSFVTPGPRVAVMEFSSMPGTHNNITKLTFPNPMVQEMLLLGTRYEGFFDTTFDSGFVSDGGDGLAAEGEFAIADFTTPILITEILLGPHTIHITYIDPLPPITLIGYWGGGPIPDESDFDGDFDLDGNDFLTYQRDPSIGMLNSWYANYGDDDSSPLSAVTGIPEPTTFILSLLGLAATLFLAMGRRRIW